MSASLVGSEMCIRDRSLGGKSNISLDERTWLKVHQPRRRTTSGQGAHAVSYTHLTLPTICSV
eukprot:13507370-Alexandrium_andersonii.AAC.1